MDTTRARALRANPTPAEKRMWRLLFSLRTDGFHFRKQAPIGPYFADIACHHAKLVIEVDGDTHGTASGVAHDRVRDAFLRQEGYIVLRFSNRDVMQNPDGVMAVVLQVLADKPRHQRVAATPSPALPTRGRVAVSVGGESRASRQARPNTLPLVGRVGEGEP